MDLAPWPFIDPTRQQILPTSISHAAPPQLELGKAVEAVQVGRVGSRVQGLGTVVCRWGEWALGFTVYCVWWKPRKHPE